MAVEFTDNELTVEGTSIKVRHPIKEALETDDTVLVVLDIPRDVEDPHNVLAFDTSGRKLWEIEAVQSKHSEKRLPYITVTVKDTQIVAKNWNSHRYEVDAETGGVTELGFFK
ncbi:hypothetical protein [Halobacterium zhouii]|uniref:hypothetical protein n=1 Tax=Halobacterium zhouii TaxID=2902624 RepID=UPI001E46EC46|nr:hypothetical protein [Halobacterium zhouii]